MRKSMKKEIRGANPEEAQRINYGMSTFMLHKAYGKNAEASLTAIQKEVERLEIILSCFNSESDISKINRSSGIKCEKLNCDTYEVLAHAVDFSTCCQGLFDVTIGPLVALWGLGKYKSMPPDNLMIKQVLPLVDYTGIILDPFQQSAGLKKAGQTINLGGIGKGFLGDKFIEVYRKYDISSAYTNIGSNVVALGTKLDGAPWQVGIQHPRRDDSFAGLLSVENKAVFTSGDFERYFIGFDGKRYHHILNPSNGYPADTGLVSVTVVSDNSMEADVLSTILFLAGMDKGIELLKNFPGAEAIFIDSSLQCYITYGLRNSFKENEGIYIEIIEPPI